MSRLDREALGAADLAPSPALARYQLAGLTIDTEFPLEGLSLPAGDPAVIRDVLIHSRAAAPTLPPGTVFKSRWNGANLLLDFPRTARFVVRDGNDIDIEVRPNADAKQIRTFLFGTVFGTLCHQRGLLPLHASVIHAADGCVAFAGPSGAGKSTLAAALGLRGHSVISDDVCFLRAGTGEAIHAWPGIRRIRLWKDALAAVGCTGPGIEQEVHGVQKYFVPIGDGRTPSAPASLHRIYALEAAEPGEQPRIEPVSGADAIEAIMKNVYRRRLARQMGRQQAMFVAAAAIGREVPVFRFVRPLDFAALSEGLDLLETHLAS